MLWTVRRPRACALAAALLCAAPAFAQVPRKPGLLSDSWQTSRHDQYNCRMSNGSVRNLTLVAQYSMAGMTWPLNQAEAPLGLLIDTPGNLYLASHNWRQVYRMSPRSFERTGTYNWAADYVGPWVPTLYPIAVNGATVALMVCNDALDVFQLRADGSVAKQQRPFGVDLWGDVCADSVRLYWVNDWSLDNPIGPRLSCLTNWTSGAGTTAWEYQTHPGNRALCENKNGGLALWDGCLYFAARYDYKSLYTGPRYDSGVSCLDRVTGAVKWFAPGLPTSRPTLYQNRCYVIEDIVTPAGQASKLVCRDAVTGASLWSVQGGSNVANKFPAIMTGNGYVCATLGGTLVCHWYTTGERKWSIPFDPSRCYNMDAYLAGYGASYTFAMYQNPNILLVNETTGTILQTIPAPAYPVSLSARSDRLYYLSRRYRVSGGKTSWPTVLTVYQDVSWLADGYAPRTLKPLELWPVATNEVAHVNGYVEGTWPLVYEWRKNGIVISGESKPYLEFVMDSSWVGASIACTVRNPYGTVMQKPLVVPAPAL